MLKVLNSFKFVTNGSESNLFITSKLLLTFNKLSNLINVLSSINPKNLPKLESLNESFMLGTVNLQNLLSLEIVTTLLLTNSFEIE